MIASCGRSSEALRRDLPAEPDFAKPVDVAERRIGEPLIVVTGRERAGRLSANRIIVEFRDWYRRVRSDYAGEVR
jgi:hypothetical protein